MGAIVTAVCFEKSELIPERINLWCRISAHLPFEKNIFPCLFLVPTCARERADCGALMSSVSLCQKLPTL